MSKEIRRIVFWAAITALGFLAAAFLFGCPPSRPTVKIEVCSVSGLLPTPYCPGKVVREFYVDERPTMFCPVHADPGPGPNPKPGPPYIAASVYQGVVFATDDVLRYIDRTADDGQNAQEFFFHASWPYPGETSLSSFSIFLRAVDASGRPLTYTDPEGTGSAVFPLFDLGIARSEPPGYVWKKNEAVAAKWRAIFGRMAARGQTAFIRFEDDTSRKNALSKRAYPFRANTLRLGPTGTSPIEADRQWYNWGGGYEHAVDISLGWLVGEMRAAGVEFYLVPMNEADERDGTPSELDARVVAFHAMFIAAAARLGVGEDRIVISTSRALATMRSRWPSAKIEIHGCNSPEAMSRIAAEFGVPRVSFNGDGFDPSALGIAGDNPGKRQPSVEQGAAMGRLVREWGDVFAVMFFARETESQAPPDINRVAVAREVVRAMVAEVWK